MPAKNNLKIVFTFVGTFIGAGFASGREIALFFGGRNIFAPILAALLCGALSFIFLEIGRLAGGDPVRALFPLTHTVWEYLLYAANFVIFAAMLAGSEMTIFEATGFSGGGILSGLLSAAIVLGGIEKIKAANAAAVPLIIIMVVILFIKSPAFDGSGQTDLVSPILYASMNMLSCGILTAKLSAGSTWKQSVFCAAAITIILLALILLVYLTVRNHADDPMPLLSIAKARNFGFAGSLLIYLAIITTMVGSMSLSSPEKPIFTLCILAAGYLVSVFGFRAIVDTAYPAIGVLGVVVSAAALFRLILLYKGKRKGAATELLRDNALRSLEKEPRQ